MATLPIAFDDIFYDVETGLFCAMSARAQTRHDTQKQSVRLNTDVRSARLVTWQNRFKKMTAKTDLGKAIFHELKWADGQMSRGQVLRENTGVDVWSVCAANQPRVPPAPRVSSRAKAVGRVLRGSWNAREMQHEQTG